MARRLATPLALLALVVAALAPPQAAAASADCAAAHVAVASGPTVREAQQATLCLLNGVRAQAHLPALRLNGRLSAAALAHSREMVARHYFAHASLDGASPFARMLRTHYVPRGASWRLGENLGWGSASLAQPIALLRMWMHSPEHRANILDPRFRDIGIGIVSGVPVHGSADGATYTTDFGAYA
jgi:uncharacterized protein YkwD